MDTAGQCSRCGSADLRAAPFRIVLSMLLHEAWYLPRRCVFPQQAERDNPNG